MKSQQARVLFVCTGNAGRSQMAEELFRRMAPAETRVCSAGVEPWERVHPMAAKLLAERGIGIQQKTPRHVQELVHEPFGLVVTIGNPARDRTPCYPGQPVRVHWDIDDPADADGTVDSEGVFRRTLSAIEERLGGLVEVIGKTVADVTPFSPGISTCVVRPEPFQPARHVPLIARAGFSCIELNCFQGEEDFAWKSQRALRELALVCEGEGVGIRSVHMLGGYPRTHVDALMVHDYVETGKVFCEIATELGAKVLVIHALRPKEEGPREWGRLMRRSIDELARHVLGLPLVLGFENLPRRESAAEDMALIESYSTAAMGFVFDNGHAHIFGASEEYLRLCGLRLCGLHIQDGNGEKDEHLLPGAGTVDWRTFMAGVVRTGYTGQLMLEVQDHERAGNPAQYLDDCMASVRMLQGYVPAHV